MTWDFDTRMPNDFWLPQSMRFTHLDVGIWLQKMIYLYRIGAFWLMKFSPSPAYNYYFLIYIIHLNISFSWGLKDQKHGYFSAPCWRLASVSCNPLFRSSPSMQCCSPPPLPTLSLPWGPTACRSGIAWCAQPWPSYASSVSRIHFWAKAPGD